MNLPAHITNLTGHLETVMRNIDHDQREMVRAFDYLLEHGKFEFLQEFCREGLKRLEREDLIG